VGAGLFEIRGLFPPTELEVVTLAPCDGGDALAGAPLNGFMVKRSAETIASPTRRSTE